MLEELTLENCVTKKLHLLCIPCPKLKKLKISDDELLGLYASVKLLCPKLEFLYLRGHIGSKFISEPMYSLRESEIYSHGETISGLFPGISHVETLTTDLYFLYECMYAARDPALPNLKSLDLSTPNHFFSIEELTQIIKNCPELKSLCLTIGNQEPWSPKLDEAETKRILTPDVKWVESFEVNGEKPKLDIQWYDNKWSDMYAKWGTQPGR